MSRGLSARSCLILAAALTCAPAVRGTAGFAEWETRTPGGHIISHMDGFKEEHGDCLRSEGTDDPRVWVSHLRRWRYHDGVVAGESEQGFFLFDERDQRLTWLAGEAELERLLDDIGAGAPLSGWLSGGDGWREAWFPFAVWRPCTEALAAGDPAPVDMTGASCRDALTDESLAFLRRTTWGFECRRARDAGKDLGPLAEFCETLVGDSP